MKCISVTDVSTDKKNAILAMHGAQWSVSRIAFAAQCSPAVVKQICSKESSAKACKLEAFKAGLLATAKLKGVQVEAIIREVLAEVEGAR